MRTHTHLSRRAFLKTSAFGAAALALHPLTSLAAAPDRSAQAFHAEVNFEPNVAAIRQPSFNPIASESSTGSITDVAMGWDGSVWGLDSLNGPQLYDAVQDAWLPFGKGIDAMTTLNYTSFDLSTHIGYVFMGEEYVTVTGRFNVIASNPTPIATTWPNLPDTFKLGVDGAASINDQLILIKGGQYVPVSGGPVKELSDMANWPKTPTWADGLIDAVFYQPAGGQDLFFLIRNGECIAANFQTASITHGPQPVANILPAQLAGQTIDAAAVWVLGVTIYFFGTSFYLTAEGTGLPPTGPLYIGAGVGNYDFANNPIQLMFTLPALWFPQLNHAPSGRAGGLWAATTDKAIVQHDGEQWNLMPGAGPSVAVGQDNSVFVAGTDANLYRWNGAGYDALGNPGASIAQVAVGDAAHVWVRDANNGVHRYQNNTFSLQTLGPGIPAPSHIAANADGSLWHCNSNNANAFRLIPEAAAPSDTITVKGGGVVSGVAKLATTGFGRAFCVATGSSGTQLYRYDAPYVFKTGAAYSMFNRDVIVHGLGRLFLIAQTNLNTPNAPIQSSLVALDAHTGVEVARTPALPSGWIYSDVTFDPSLELLYVGTAPTNASDAQSQSQLLALDARTLKTAWSFTQTSSGLPVKGIDAAPALSGSLLAFGDRSGNLVVLDTQQALGQSQQGQSITNLTEWLVSFTVYPNPGVIRMPTPVFMADRVYGVIHNITATTLQSAVYTHNTTASLFDQTIGLADVNGTPDSLLLIARRPPVIVTGYHPAAPETPALAINRYSSVAVVDPSSVAPAQTFSLPSGFINTGLTVDDGVRAGQQLSTTPDLSALRLWFCDSLGNLWALGLNTNGQWAPQNGTPRLIQSNTYLSSTPTLHKDPAGGATILFGMLSIGGSSNILYGFDPDTGNLASLPTGQTAILALSRSTPNGVVYAGGIDLSNLGNVSNATGIPQVLGIRVDALTQGLRDFIADSQMMQDPDPNAPGGDLTDATNPIPPSRPRYQTHITLVDNDPSRPGSTTPLPFEPVKIWADRPITIAVNGNTYAIGPGDTEYAHVAAGGDGTLVVTSGYTSADDPPDMYAATLKLWAGFMNPFERVVVHPDYEFHARVALAHANASDDNPDKPNLITAKSYAATKNTPTPAPLFSAGEISAGQPQNCANAIAQMRSGVGFGTAVNSAPALLARHKAQLCGDKTTTGSAAQTTQRYVAYADTPGTGYHPDNALTTRPVVVVQPTGLTFVKPQGQPTTAATLTTTNWSSAQSAIDALPAPSANPPWATLSNQAGMSEVTPASPRNVFSKFWDWLKNAIKTAVVDITHVIVSVANEVMVGIRVLVNGVEHIFKAVVKVLDDIASAIGALFSMLLKIIEDVIAVLGWFFEFGQFIATHNALKTELLGRISQLNTTLVAQIKSAVDQFFNEGETAIINLFNQIRSQFGSQAVEQQSKMGATAHTALTVNAAAGGTSNQAVPGMWATQKLKTGMGGSSGAPASASNTAKRTLDDTDPLSTFLNGFVASLTGNGALATVFNQFKSDATKLLSPKSARQFLATLMSTLLDIIEALLVGALTVGQALVDGLLDALPSVLNLLFGAQGLLTTQLNIPVLSWLYEKLFGEPLTFTNVVLLITSIPVTLIYRIGYGVWPANDNSQVNANSAQAPAFSVKALGRVVGFFGGIAAFAGGIANFFVDIDDDTEKDFASLAVAISTLLAAAAFPIADIGNLNRYELAGFGVGICVAVLGFVGVATFKNAGTQKFMDKFVPILNCVLNIALFSLTIVSQVKFPNSVAAFTAGLVSTFPGIVNPLKLTKVEALVLIVGAVDVLSGIVICALNLVTALSASVPPQRRQLYFPWISRPGSATPLPFTR